MVYGLLNQRVSSTEGVWIDQCCIRQNDDFEKGLAIGCMDLIYKSARRVVVALEDINGISDEQEILLQGLFTKYDSDNWRPLSKDLDTLLDILIRIL